MSDISILDLQNLRHLIGGYSTTHCKMTEYAKDAQDPEAKKLFQDADVYKRQVWMQKKMLFMMNQSAEKVQILC